MIWARSGSPTEQALFCLEMLEAMRCQRVDLTDHAGGHCCDDLADFKDVYRRCLRERAPCRCWSMRPHLRLYEERDSSASEHRLRMALDNVEMGFLGAGPWQW